MNTGNMYNWIGDSYNPLGGMCPHACPYCYRQDIIAHYPGLKKKYTGRPRIELQWLQNIPLTRGDTVFVGSMNDLFADAITCPMIEKVLERCKRHQDQMYLFQTKNPRRFLDPALKGKFPADHISIYGTTIETDAYPIMSSWSRAPGPRVRAKALSEVAAEGLTTMVSVEPIIQFNLDELVALIKGCRPAFVSIGADSKHRVPRSLEPLPADVRALLAAVGEFSEVRVKKNLNRILKRK